MSVLDLKPKVVEDTTTAVSTLDNLKMESDMREGEAQFANPGDTAHYTQTELANHTFYQQSLEIKGVSVQVQGGSSWSEKTILVTIPDLFDSAADEVFNLKGRIHQQFPQGRLDVLVKPSHLHNSESQ